MNTSTTQDGSGDLLQAGSHRPNVVREMFDRVSPRYDLLNRLLTFGLDQCWRRQAVRSLELPPHCLIADLACGTGDFCAILEQKRMLPVGVDFSPGMLSRAKSSAPLVHADVMRLPFPDGSLEGAVCGFALRNLEALPPFLAETARILCPGGRVAFLEIALPSRALPRRVHGFYFRKVAPLIGGWLSDKEAYRYLPESVKFLPPAEELIEMMTEAGFAEVKYRTLGAGVAGLFTATIPAEDEVD